MGIAGCSQLSDKDTSTPNTWVDQRGCLDHKENITQWFWCQTVSMHQSFTHITQKRKKYFPRAEESEAFFTPLHQFSSFNKTGNQVDGTECPLISLEFQVIYCEKQQFLCV